MLAVLKSQLVRATK